MKDILEVIAQRSHVRIAAKGKGRVTTKRASANVILGCMEPTAPSGSAQPNVKSMGSATPLQRRVCARKGGREQTARRKSCPVPENALTTASATSGPNAVLATKVGQVDIATRDHAPIIAVGMVPAMRFRGSVRACMGMAVVHVGPYPRKTLGATRAPESHPVNGRLYLRTS